MQRPKIRRQREKPAQGGPQSRLWENAPLLAEQRHAVKEYILLASCARVIARSQAKVRWRRRDRPLVDAT